MDYSYSQMRIPPIFIIAVLFFIANIIKKLFCSPKKQPRAPIVYTPPEVKSPISHPVMKKEKNNHKGVGLQAIPASMWGINVRSRYPQAWKHISREVRQKARQVCANCQQKYPMELLDAHEIWVFKAVDGIMTQVLTDIACVCKRCHVLAHPTRYATQYRNNPDKMRVIQQHWCNHDYSGHSSWSQYLKHHQNANKKVEREAWARFHRLSHHEQTGFVRNNKGGTIPFQMDLQYLNQHFRHHLNQDAKANEMPYLEWKNVQTFNTA